MANKLTPETIKKAMAASSAEEILAIAKENSIELTLEQAEAYYEKLRTNEELSAEELSNVAGGVIALPHVPRR